jgi:hypothetical protein
MKEPSRIEILEPRIAPASVSLTYTDTIASTCRRVLAAAIVSLTALGAATATEAAVIVWGAAQNITADTDVSTTGTLVGAASVFGSTVNGVTFAGGLLQNGTVGIFTTSNFSSISSVDADPALSPAYRSLLTPTPSVAVGQSATLTISGLTVGESYAFQWWSNAQFFNDSGELTSAGGAPLDANTTDNGLTGRGQFQIGTLIADNAIQQIVFNAVGANGAGVADGFVNAVQVRQLSPGPGGAVPEPGSALVGMMALGLCGFGATRRRRA